uniref:Phylloplanin n=1 Tax=Lotus japonicus TaxID=34305 RepID=I3SRC2_LOTJA|nr:unknown [Lotus japonicus]
MTLKHLIMMISLLIAVMAIPQAHAQLGILNDLLGSVNIRGTVSCTSNDNNAAAAIPGFSNAQVQLQCGEKVFSDATTDGDGMFSMMVNPLLYDLSSLLSGCNLVIPTPLSKCNSNLPSIGGLISTLRYVGLSHVGTETIANMEPSGFHFKPSV